MSRILQDMHYALRQLRKGPGFTAVAMVTLALGIGATTAMFSLVDGALFRSLHYPHADELVSVGVTAPIIDGEFLFSSTYVAWKHEQTAFSGFTSTTGVNDCDITDDRPVRVTCAAVESTFLPTFGVQPVLGRNFTPEEDRPGTPKVALLSYGVWQSRFGGDPSVANRTISLDGKAARIVGVLPRDFEFPTLAHVGLVVPQALDESIAQQGPVVRAYGRLKPGLSVEAAAAQLIRFRQDEHTLTAALTVIGVTGNTQNQGLGDRVGPEYYVVRRHAADDTIFRYPDSKRISIVARSAMDPQTVAKELRDSVATLDPTLPVESSTLGQTVSPLAARPRFSATLLTLFAAIGLLLAAAGIYGLVSLLVSQRTQEIAIRVALGASPSSVTRTMVVQISIWIVLGAAAGICCSLIAAHWVRALLFGIKPNDPVTLAGAAIVLLVVALVAAYVPARRAARVDPMVALRYE